MKDNKSSEFEDESAVKMETLYNLDLVKLHGRNIQRLINSNKSHYK